MKICLTGRPFISATKYERSALRCSDCFKRYVADLLEGVKEDEKFDETADVAIALYTYSGGERPFIIRQECRRVAARRFRSRRNLND
ncbi:MAG: hypothetical protein J2P21_18640 [Chloracidobacterium sp.]|nr:hypothetical protein [Chloracidobacterium sp.]